MSRQVGFDFRFDDSISHSSSSAESQSSSPPELFKLLALQLIRVSHWTAQVGPHAYATSIRVNQVILPWIF